MEVPGLLWRFAPRVAAAPTGEDSAAPLPIDAIVSLQCRSSGCGPNCTSVCVCVCRELEHLIASSFVGAITVEGRRKCVRTHSYSGLLWLRR
jgi:hypothetical protein